MHLENNVDFYSLREDDFLLTSMKVDYMHRGVLDFIIHTNVVAGW